MAESTFTIDANRRVHCWKTTSGLHIFVEEKTVGGEWKVGQQGLSLPLTGGLPSTLSAAILSATA